MTVADRDECASNKPVCADGSMCENTNGSFRCRCPDGFFTHHHSCHGLLLYCLLNRKFSLYLHRSWRSYCFSRRPVCFGCLVFSARCNIYISRLCYDVSVRLSVTEVHWRIIANLGFKSRSHFTAYCGRRAACGRIISRHASQC